MYVHALHTVHALPDLRVAAGRLRDGASVDGYACSSADQPQLSLIAQSDKWIESRCAPRRDVGRLADF